MNQISIIIPCFNVADHITEAIQSAIEQVGVNFEIIVVDDGSNKETKAALEKLSFKIDRLITQSNMGVSVARNVGIEAASGDIIAVLDADDYFEPDFCKKAAGILRLNEDVKIVTCYCRRILDGKELDIIKPESSVLKDFLQFNRALGSVMFRREDWAAVQGYDESMKEGFEDWEFYIRLLEKGGSSKVIPEVLFNYRLRKDSKTSEANKVKKQLHKYIISKHKSLYFDFFDDTIDHFLTRLEIIERANRKLFNSLEFKVGNSILSPLRNLKRLLK